VQSNRISLSQDHETARKEVFINAYFEGLKSISLSQDDNDALKKVRLHAGIILNQFDEVFPRKTTSSIEEEESLISRWNCTNCQKKLNPYNDRTDFDGEKYGVECNKCGTLNKFEECETKQTEGDYPGDEKYKCNKCEKSLRFSEDEIVLSMASVKCSDCSTLNPFPNNE
jgi:DNA-directed RNA polymerase subunit RPC12/RpoP